MILFDRLFGRFVREANWRWWAPPARSAVMARQWPGGRADNATARAIALNPALGAAETYMGGRLVREQGDFSHCPI